MGTSMSFGIRSMWLKFWSLNSCHKAWYIVSTQCESPCMDGVGSIRISSAMCSQRDSDFWLNEQQYGVSV